MEKKVEERGSIYGNASREVSDRVAELRANSEISKVESMFADHHVSA